MTMPAYEEMQGSPTEGAGQQGVAASMRLLCAWEDRWDLLAGFLDTLTVYPHKTDLTIVAISGSMEPLGGSDDAGDSLVEYEKAIVTVNFGPRPFLTTPGEGDPAPSDLYAESLEVYIDNEPFQVGDPMSVKGKFPFSWSADGKSPITPREAPSWQYKGLKYVFTRYNQDTVPVEAFTLAGTVNASAVTAVTLGVTFEAETLLYLPPTLSRTTRTDGTNGWTIVYSFNYKPNFNYDGDALGWNYYYRGDIDDWTTMYRQPNAAELGVDPDAPYQPYKIYPTGNFAAL